MGALYAAIRWPARWLFQAAVLNVLDVCRKEVKHTLNDIYAVELKERAETAALAAKADEVNTAQDESIKAFGVAMRDIPRMVGAMEQMTKTLERLDETLIVIVKTQSEHGEDLGRLSGYVEGRERRRAGRRKDDPPLPHDP